MSAKSNPAPESSVVAEPTAATPSAPDNPSSGPVEAPAAGSTRRRSRSAREVSEDLSEDPDAGAASASLRVRVPHHIAERVDIEAAEQGLTKSSLLAQVLVERFGLGRSAAAPGPAAPGITEDDLARTRDAITEAVSQQIGDLHNSVTGTVDDLGRVLRDLLAAQRALTDRVVQLEVLVRAATGAPPIPRSPGGPVPASHRKQ
jgi:hypothetical protein